MARKRYEAEEIIAHLREVEVRLILGEEDLSSAKIEGDREPLGMVLSLLDLFNFWFGIVEP